MGLYRGISIHMYVYVYINICIYIYIRIVEKKMETTSLGFRVASQPSHQRLASTSLTLLRVLLVHFPHSGASSLNL